MSGFRPASLTACPPREPPPLFEQEHRNPKELIYPPMNQRKTVPIGESGTFNVRIQLCYELHRFVAHTRITERRTSRPPIRPPSVSGSDCRERAVLERFQRQHERFECLTIVIIKVSLLLVTRVTRCTLAHMNDFDKSLNSFSLYFFISKNLVAQLCRDSDIFHVTLIYTM